MIANIIEINNNNNNDSNNNNNNNNNNNCITGTLNCDTEYENS